MMPNINRIRFIFFLIVIISIISCLSQTGIIRTTLSKDKKALYKEWNIYGGGNENIKYSALEEINTKNVKNLQVAWRYSSGEASSTNRTDMKTNAIIIDGTLYALNPQLKLFALDAATGKEKWVYDPLKVTVRGRNTGRGEFAQSTKISRGVTYYKGGGNDQRILYTPGGGHMLYCVDALTGKLITSFGNNGMIDLHDDLGKNQDDLHISNTTPGIIYKDMIILGSRLAESEEAAPGHIRAYDVHSGKLRWIFHTIPQPGQPGFESWEDPEAYKYAGGANVWGGFSLDEKRGIVFAGTGSATPDFYGGNRKGNNQYANCVLALDAATGKLMWHYQTVHHDLWDWDQPTHPILATVKKDGRNVDVVIQITKQGFIFMFDRVTGKPVYPIEEVPVPKSDLKGEWTSATQPVPTFFKPFVRQAFREEDLFKDGIPDASYQEIKAKWKTLKTNHMWNPPSEQGTLQIPGWNGGAEWGGPSYDPTTGIMYINANESPWIMKMTENRSEVTASSQTNLEAGRTLYTRVCSSCHGGDKRGGETTPALGANPSLINLRFSEPEFKSLITTGRGNMPPFGQLTEGEKTALASYILNLEAKQKELFNNSVRNTRPAYFATPYRVTGSKFLTREGYPAIAPPWGHLTAINLNTGKEVWKKPIGDYPELKAKGIHSGSENFGSSAVTAGGLVFIAATRDEKIRAFNKMTGELLWEADLPAAGIATPSVYQVNGKQYVVIACGGGGKQMTKSGDTYVAFALPGIK